MLGNELEGLGKEWRGLDKTCKSGQRVHFVGKYVISLGKENLWIERHLLQGQALSIRG